MQAVEQDQDPMGQVFALASDCDATQLKLTAAEGYLLSRIDGSTPWRLLREIGGIPADEADCCLKRWVEEGLLDVVGGTASGASSRTGGGRSASPDSGSKPAEAAESSGSPIDSTPGIDESLLDDSLELELETQRRILEFEASLGRPYHELLGVVPGAEPRVVKRAYFKLSKEFHPDRYFRRQIGSYGERLERIFKKILEAHEMLSDPDLCRVENQPDAASSMPEASSAGPTAVAKDPGGPASRASSETTPVQPRKLSKLERLRQRMPFKINQEALAERRAKADEIFRAAETSLRAGRLAEAEANIRIAISFDPGRAEFKEALGSLKIQAAGARASKLLASPSERMSKAELWEALGLLEDVLMYRPHDPELNERAARVCLQLEKYDAAREFAETLVERTPDDSGFHALLGKILRGAGDPSGALEAFERALKLDEDNQEARRGLASLRIGTRDAGRGGVS
ncbi:MAG TPA: tetratricopeptide repeat protein [Deltaproteobacteria bacterium]|nr:tetratricopeptide repeat protein [Deltaproteobacteria bacterium]